MIEPALPDSAWRVGREDGQRLRRAPPGSQPKDSRTQPDASLRLRLMLKLVGPFAPDEML